MILPAKLESEKNSKQVDRLDQSIQLINIKYLDLYKKILRACYFKEIFSEYLDLNIKVKISGY